MRQAPISDRLRIVQSIVVPSCRNEITPPLRTRDRRALRLSVIATPVIFDCDAYNRADETTLFLKCSKNLRCSGCGPVTAIGRLLTHRAYLIQTTSYSP